jgi:hypothetical protein
MRDISNARWPGPCTARALIQVELQVAGQEATKDSRFLGYFSTAPTQCSHLRLDLQKEPF